MSENENDEMKEFVAAANSVSVREERAHRLAAPDSACDEVASDEDEQDKVSKAKMWAASANDYFPCETAVDELSPGQYIVNYSNTQGVYFTKKEINLDDLLVLPDSNSEMVLEHINSFWGKEETFRKYGFLWKRGIMLWGPPGSGKTSTVQQLSKQIVDKGGITIYCVQPNLTAQGIAILRKIEPIRPIVVIFEDIDAIISEYGESDLLAMLDGELQTDNVVFVATTNYPNRLDKRFINRPSRFDEIIKIGMPTPEARRYFLQHKNPTLDEAGRDEWVDLTDGFSVAHLKELIISVECFDKSVQNATAKLRTMMTATLDDYEYNDKKPFGFTETNT